MKISRKFILSAFLVVLMIAQLIIYWQNSTPLGQLDFSSKSYYLISLFESKFAYFYLLLFSIVFPFILSFDKKVFFIGNWKAFLLTFITVGGAYILWDVYFTHWGIWGFNSEYLYGIDFSGLPVEEILFFVVAPYACLFIYECVIAYRLDKWFGGMAWMGSWLLIPLSLFLFIIYSDKYYSFSASFVGLIILLIYLLLMPRLIKRQVFTALFLSFIPFFIINSGLTGSFTIHPIVVYNNMETTGIRLGSIPIEDFYYQMGMVLWYIFIYDSIKRKYWKQYMYSSKQ